MTNILLATLLLIQIGEGTVLTPWDNGVFYEQDGEQRSLLIVPRDEALVTIDAASRDAAVTMEEGVVLGYRSTLLRHRAEGGETRELWLDFGGDHLLLSARPGAEAGEAGEPAPPADTPLRDAFRPGTEAGRHPGRIELLLDGLSLEDTANRVPLDFFAGPLTLEIRAVREAE